MRGNIGLFLALSIVGGLGMRGRRGVWKKKVVSAVLLLAPLVPLLKWGAMVEGSPGEWWFLWISVGLAILSLALIYGPRYIHGRRSAGADERREGGEGSRLLDFVRLFLSRFFVGEMLTSIYGLFLFVLFAMTLTQWLPNGVQAGDPVFTVATVLYVIDMILLSAWVYGPLERGKPQRLHPKTRYLVYGLSSPVVIRNGQKVVLWDPNRIKSSRCEDLRRDLVRINIVPLYVSIYYHFRKLEKLFLLYSNVHLTNKLETQDGLRAFFEKAAKCLNGEYGACVSFRLHWEEVFANESTELVPSDGCSRVVDVHFINIGSANDVMEVYKDLKGDENLSEVMERERNEVTFHVTGGTAVVSAAMMLHAIKADVHAEYLRQDAAGKEPEESLKGMDIDVFEDLDDLIREIRDYFEG